MGKGVDCKDLQTEGNYPTSAVTAEEEVQKIGEHIQTGHARKGFSKELYQKAIGATHDQRSEQEMTPDEVLCEVCSGVCLC